MVRSALHRQIHQHRSFSTIATTRRYVGTGLTFDDGEQLLVSLQKPLGMILEQVDDESAIVVADVDAHGPAARAGVQAGHILLAVQNMDIDGQPLENVLKLIGEAPPAVNLRFLKLI